MWTQDSIMGPILLSTKQVVKVSVTRQFKCLTSKCKLILSLSTTTPEQPNPSEAKGQNHRPSHPPRSWTSQKPRHPKGSLSYSGRSSSSDVPYVQRLFRCSDSDMTCLSHVTVFASDLISVSYVFKANVSSPCCRKTNPNTFQHGLHAANKIMIPY